MSYHFQPGRRVDGGLALFFALGHPSVVELAAHAGLLGAAHGCLRVSSAAPARRDGAERRFRVAAAGALGER